MKDVCDHLVDSAASYGASVYFTVIVNMDDLTSANHIAEISSVVTSTKASGIYLIFVSNVEPRRDLYDPESIKGALKLISLLKQAGMSVLVGYCSSDMILWKTAGADSCATGKYFNLRRFTKSRFEEPSGGGGQLPYFFYEPLVAFLRESDILRLEKAHLLSVVNSPYTPTILDAIHNGRNWLGTSWRHYLYTFADLEERISSGITNVPVLLKKAEELWEEINNNNILMEETRNNGSWIRPWRISLSEYNQIDL